jgi:hypothetical protein
MKFPDKLLFADGGMRGDSRLFILLAVYRYLSDRFGEIEVPAGFITDGASVPRIFWNIFAPFGDYFCAAIIHDFLYSKHNRHRHRAECDLIFLEAMEAAGVPWLRRRLIYRAVRLGGWAAFKGDPPPKA